MKKIAFLVAVSIFGLAFITNAFAGDGSGGGNLERSIISKNIDKGENITAGDGSGGGNLEKMQMKMRETQKRQPNDDNVQSDSPTHKNGDGGGGAGGM